MTEGPKIETKPVAPVTPKPVLEVPNLNAAPIPSDKPVVTPTPALNAAGPETEAKKEIAKTVAKQQTKVQTGPEIWIMLTLAFALAGGWHAWKKQQS